MGECPRDGPCRSPPIRVRLSIEAILPSNRGARTRVERTALGAVAAGLHPRREDHRPALQSPRLLPGADPECFLCHAAPTGDDRPRLIVDRGVHTVTLLNRYPYNNGHLLVAPQRHLARLDELGDDVAVGGFADDRPDGGRVGESAPAAGIQHRGEPRPGGGGGRARPPPLAHRPPLGRRHELHARHRRRAYHPAVARSAVGVADGGNGKTDSKSDRLSASHLSAISTTDP